MSFKNKITVKMKIGMNKGELAYINATVKAGNPITVSFQKCILFK